MNIYSRNILFVTFVFTVSLLSVGCLERTRLPTYENNFESSRGDDGASCSAQLNASPKPEWLDRKELQKIWSQYDLEKYDYIALTEYVSADSTDYSFALVAISNDLAIKSWYNRRDSFQSSSKFSEHLKESRSVAEEFYEILIHSEVNSQVKIGPLIHQTCAVMYVKIKGNIAFAEIYGVGAELENDGSQLFQAESLLSNFTYKLDKIW